MRFSVKPTQLSMSQDSKAVLSPILLKLKNKNGMVLFTMSAADR